MFSPYYAWSGRGDPRNHVALNAVLYGPRGKRWAMTERGRDALDARSATLSIGPSALEWDGRGLTIHIDELTAPFPLRLRGQVRVEPTGLNRQAFALDAEGRHIWRPIAPAARVTARFTQPGVTWSGGGYFDMNAGCEPLEDAFHDWMWSRATLARGAAVLYDARRRNGQPLSLALRFDASGAVEHMPAPPLARLPSTLWRMPRATRSDDGQAQVVRGFEDAPFYSRSLVHARVFGERVESMHESLSLTRVANPIVRLMLPVKMRRGLG